MLVNFQVHQVSQHATCWKKNTFIQACTPARFCCNTGIILGLGSANERWCFSLAEPIPRIIPVKWSIIKNIPYNMTEQRSDIHLRKNTSLILTSKSSYWVSIGNSLENINSVVTKPQCIMRLCLACGRENLSWLKTGQRAPQTITRTSYNKQFCIDFQTNSFCGQELSTDSIFAWQG